MKANRSLILKKVGEVTEQETPRNPVHEIGFAIGHFLEIGTENINTNCR